MITNDVLEFSSKHCKINYHNQCSGKWIGLGFTIICTCNCHKEINEKNIVLDGPGKSSNTQCTNQILNLAKDADQI